MNCKHYHKCVQIYGYNFNLIKVNKNYTNKFVTNLLKKSAKICYFLKKKINARDHLTFKKMFSNFPTYYTSEGTLQGEDNIFWPVT